MNLDFKVRHDYEVDKDPIIISAIDSEADIDNVIQNENRDFEYSNRLRRMGNIAPFTLPFVIAPASEYAIVNGNLTEKAVGVCGLIGSFVMLAVGLTDKKETEELLEEHIERISKLEELRTEIK